tara:strand:- start:5 stop:322 length:318 start_codon:yes stop_codon:yes gene_type:complete
LFTGTVPVDIVYSVKQKNYLEVIMYINNQKRKLDPRDLDTVENAEYFTCIYYKPQGQSIREEHKTYKKAYIRAKAMTLAPMNWNKKKFMFYAVKGTSQTFIGGLK